MKLDKNFFSLLRGDSFRAQLLRGGIGSMLIKVISTILAFILAMLLARMLGPEGYGVYSFVLSVLMLLAIPIQSGLPHLIVREVSKAHMNKNWPILQGMLRWNTIVIYSVSLILIIVLIMVIWIAEKQISDARRETFLVGLLMMPLSAFIVTQGAVLRGFGKVILGQVPNNIIRPGLFIISLLIIGWLMPSNTMTPQYVICLQVLTLTIAFLIGFLLLSHLKEKEGIKSNKLIQIKHESWFKAVLPLTLVSGFQLLNSSADIVILGLIRSDEEVGVYRIVAQMVSLVTFGLFAINQVLHPHFAKLHSTGDKVKLQRLVSASAKVILIVAIPPVLLFIFAGAPVLKIFFGEEYMIGAFALGILSVGQLANAGFGSVGALLNMTGHEKDSMKGMMIAASVNICLNILLIPELGMTGAALATAISMFIWNAILRSYVKKRLDIESFGWVITR